MWLWTTLFFVLTSCFLYNFSKKLLSILYLEGMMLCLILSIIFFMASSPSNIVYLFFLSVIMVLESVLAISLFMSSSRNTSNMSAFFFC